MLRSVVAAGLLTLSCSESASDIAEDAAAPVDALSDGTRDAADSSASESTFVFQSGEVELEPGDEKYVCWTTNLPDDDKTVVTGISADYGPGTHHVFLAWTLAQEPEGLSECPVLFKTTWIPLYLGGVNTSPLALPAGAGIELDAGRQLVLQLHLQNTTPDTVTNRVTAHLELGRTNLDYTPAGIFGLDNHAIELPPRSEDVETSMTCKPDRDMSVFSILGHMHKLGDRLWLRREQEILFEQEWFFDDQPITPVSLGIAASDTLELGCRHDNPFDETVGYGESSDSEMCAIVLYYTPYDGLDGCIYAPGTDMP